MRYLHNQEGFSLIEILVALTLGALLVMAFSGAFSVGFQTEARMDDRLETRRVIDNVIEELRNEDLSGVIDAASLKSKLVDDYNIDQETLNVTEVDNNLYYIKIEIENYSTEALVAAGN
ncbi:PulJ/GspJ family protein [Halarsenatibacter silvermanii]|uniref:Prepilin-type N-terminal cleavage/methylation domain-containing protein n=1 Tax=Halarsenatibacter silvermanii TaxID=321763 RepID=A0A1G9LCE9_9FIRM|nr:type II secretion system protein [Halarsenatibacter silvermanii]SDL59669.1 prepilin-type N-terminal cleavage/methylation domain-containing protein [Halarsenatibacter silvermanii]